VVAETLLAGQQLQVGLAQRRQVLAARRRAEADRGRVRTFFGHLLGADAAATALAARVDLQHLVGMPEAQRPAHRVGLRDRCRLELADADDQAGHLAGLVVELRPVARVQRRRLVAVGDEHQRRHAGQRLGHRDAAVQRLGHLAVA
jgi:hypothetical protein